MPKVKTHHWSGVSLSMKNMFAEMILILCLLASWSTCGEADTRSEIQE